ncbi:MAG: metallophosphoesterase family protein [Planctomycetes bacterium]|nr:metallophosphoesterase family protein [Planctomycetota bacterium]
MESRIAFVSDVHGNLEAFQSVLQDIAEEGVTEIYHLGDIIGYGEAGAACLRILREKGIRTVQGNHDGNIRPPRDEAMRPEAQWVLEREFNLLTEEEIDWLMKLPDREIIDDLFIIVHGALTHRDDYIIDSKSFATNMEIMNSRYGAIPLCFFGHSHMPMVLGGAKAETSFHDNRTIKLENFVSYFINPGSVGQPRDKCPLASYAIYDREANTITIRRVEYDIEAEQLRMQEQNLPDKLIRRIALGR